MPLTINSNINALTAQRSMVVGERLASQALQRLSSGLRINSAKDDAAGMAIADRMTSQVRGLNQAARNANDGISMAQTAEGALSNSSAILQRVRELAVQSANATNSAGDRQALNREAVQLIDELGRIAQNTEFNGQKLLDGTYSTSLLQVGANGNQTIPVSFGNASPETLGLNQTGFTFGYGANHVGNQSWGVNGVIAGNISVQGTQNANVAVSANESAESIAAKINAQSAATGVSAEAATSLRFGGFVPGRYVLTIQNSNNVPVGVSFDVPSNDALGMEVVAKAFNAVTDQTDVVAFTADFPPVGRRVVLQNSSGADIRIADTGFPNAGVVGVLKTSPSVVAHSMTAGFILNNDSVAESMTTSGSLTFYSSDTFSVVGVGTNAVSTTPTFSSLSALVSLDISTQVGAKQAILMVDAALSEFSSQRSSLGALQSRFEAATTNLQVSAENLSASRSRIEDADFATETATLSKAQILQQASTAMVAQANQLHKQVLTLLQ